MSQSVKLDSILNKVSVGISTGINFPSMYYSDQDIKYQSSLFPRGIVGLFAEIKLKKNFSIRPEMAFIGKGQIIDDLGIKYKFSSNYFDVRLPVIYNLRKMSSFEPYLFLAPTLGFATGGMIKFQDMKKEITNASIASADFGLMLGCGAKCPVKIMNYDVLIGAEVNYNVGLSDTYSKKEIDETAIALNRFSYSIDGTRKNRGLGITVSFAVPLKNFASLLAKKEKQQIVEKINHQPEIISSKKPEIPNKDCYTIEEMLSYLDKGYDVNDRKICLYTINFETAKSIIDKPSMEYLKQIVNLLEKFPTTKMKINGHTDNVGTEEYNLQLSKNRALAVYNYLISQSIKSERLSYAYFGTKYPVSSNDTEEGRRNNRRVEFEMQNRK
ncbi:MAG: OmpA family protein [Prolixibacteraceae bacterium]|nr:OmpA family protein [Prolixibacteraceae bacterium]